MFTLQWIRQNRVLKFTILPSYFHPLSLWVGHSIVGEICIYIFSVKYVLYIVGTIQLNVYNIQFNWNEL